jgi:lipopolysaccharide transport system permease protein
MEGLSTKNIALSTQATTEFVEQPNEATYPASRPFATIMPPSGKASFNWHEIWSYRELLYFLVWRDFLVRYKQTVLGALWELLKPLSLMLVLTFFMGYIMKVQTDGVPFILFYFSGTVLWTFFSQCLGGVSLSVLGAGNLVTKIYFPRIVIPIGTLLSNFFDLAISFLVLLLLLACYGHYPSFRYLVLPLAVVWSMSAALGLGLLFAAMVVRYRDFQNVVPMLTLLWMFSSPVVYPVSMVPQKWQALYCINPMAGPLTIFRWVLTGGELLSWKLMIPGAIVAFLMLAIGLIFFQRHSSAFGDWL